MEHTERLTRGTPPLLQWYQDNARTLPWRSDPTPYRVWVSEIMLQQTRVTAVLGYFQRFMEALPTPEALAACPEEVLLKLWQGLGYYSRARNLQRTAQVLCTQYGGSFPRTMPELLALPGIGEYTAGAIASIAFDLPVPAVDGNVLRVTTRLLADSRDITRPATRKDLTALLQQTMPRTMPGTFNQALMELGALVCLPNGAPLCDRCPWAALCLTRQQGSWAAIPARAPKPPRKVEQRQVFLLFHQNRVALRQRPKKGLLSSLWEFPNEVGSTLPLDSWGISPLSMEEGGRGRHIFTHIEWNLTGVVVHTATAALPAGWVWATGQELAERYPIPSAFAAFRERVEAELYREDPHAL